MAEPQLTAMQLSVAVCTYNPDAGLLARTLRAIVCQLDGPIDAELLVVDNNSSPALEARGVVDAFPARLITEARPGLTAAREAAIYEAAGDLILFVDDDNVLDPGYLKSVAEAFAADPKLGLFGGCVAPEYEIAPPEWVFELETQLAIRRYPPDLYEETTDVPFTDYFPVGAGFSVRRSLALAYLKDCEQTATIQGRRGTVLSAGEDVDLGLYVLSTGHKLAVSGRLGLTHVIPAARLTTTYLARLSVGAVTSAQALDSKWAGRFDKPVFPVLSSISLPGLLARTLASSVLRLWSPRHAVRYAFHKTLARLRLSRTAKDGEPA